MKRIIWLSMFLAALFFSGVSDARPGGGHPGGGHYGGGHSGYHGGGFHGGNPGYHPAPAPAPRRWRANPRFYGGRYWYPRWWRGGFYWTAYPPFWVIYNGTYGYYWYYCPTYNRFYPETMTCPMPWQLVPADNY